MNAQRYRLEGFALSNGEKTFQSRIAVAGRGHGPEGSPARGVSTAEVTAQATQAAGLAYIVSIMLAR
jgi:hypothetical protein